MEKVTKLNLKIIQESHTHLQTMTEALAIFHRDEYTIVGGIANTMCPMSSGDGKKTECFSLKMIGLNSKVECQT